LLKPAAPNIRRALPADVPALKSCMDAAYAKYTSRISDLPSVSEGIEEDIQNHQVWVVIEDNNLIAGLILVAGEEYIKVVNLAVHSDHGGKGIGHKLMQHSENEARRQDYNEMRLNTHIAMPENVELYKYWGWQETARNENTVSMKKLLDTAD